MLIPKILSLSFFSRTLYDLLYLSINLENFVDINIFFVVVIAIAAVFVVDLFVVVEVVVVVDVDVVDVVVVATKSNI